MPLTQQNIRHGLVVAAEMEKHVLVDCMSANDAENVEDSLL